MKCRIAPGPIFIAPTFGYETKTSQSEQHQIRVRTLSIPKNTLQKLD